MTPITPVVPGIELSTVVFAKDQPEYLQLPAHVTPDGRVVTRWRLTWREKLQVVLGGCLWLQVLTFNSPLQPVKISTECPLDDIRSAHGV